jgi:hypothetical protein
MKKKLFGIFVCTLLIITMLPATGTINEKIMDLNDENESIPILMFKDISTDNNLLGFSVELMNIGGDMTGSINWSMNVSGGLYDFRFFKCFFVPKKITSGVIESLGENETGTIKIGPLLAFGRFSVAFNCTYKINSMINESKLNNCEADISVLREYGDQGDLFIYHTFPPEQQPTIKWINIDDYDYKAGGWVEFNNVYYPPPNNTIGVLQKHNVRVYDTSSQQTLFLGSCKFINGNATIKECHVTLGLVNNQNTYWQVELVNDH